jgi:type IV pilus assembly protein PilE
VNQKGFNLIELLIAMAVLGILTSVAFPAYQGYVQTSRRADAKAGLLTFANAMERAFNENNQYTKLAEGDADTGTPKTSVFVPPSALSSYYTFTIKEATATTFKLQAAPKGAQVGDACGTMTVTDTGFTDAAAAGCW